MRTETVTLPPFLDAYQAGGFARQGPGWLRELRESAMARYAETGLPQPGDEAWRHTDLRPVAQGGFRPAVPSVGAVSAAEAERHHFPGEGGRMVFVDGNFEPSLSHRARLPAGIRIRSLAEALRDGDEEVEAHLGRHADPDEPLTALNLGFLEDGAVVTAEPGTVAPDPIHLLWLSSGARPEPTLVSPRLLVLAGRGAQLSVVETHATLGTAPTFTNAVAEVVADEGAVVRHVKLQRESLKAAHIASLHARAFRQGRVETFLFSFGGGTARNEARVHLDGEGAECSVDGLFLGTGRQSVDCVSRIEHGEPHTTSRQLYKGILDGAAHGAFSGHVLVRADAQKTDAVQTNRNLLLSPKALVDSVPGLEIHADDVKCSHGSSIGRLDENALFFLRSRGLGSEAARLMLTQAFAREVLERVAHPGLRSHLDGLLQSWFAGRKDMEVHE